MAFFDSKNFFEKKIAFFSSYPFKEMLFFKRGGKDTEFFDTSKLFLFFFTINYYLC